MDYDVGITGLTSPPASATKSAYRPAVSVRNNGIHDALASGVLRIYAAGQLIYTSEIYSPTISPGQTKDAEAIDYWTPTTEGFYVIIADVSTPLDQFEPNNHLYPTTIEVTGLPPEPPSPVEPHAPQHEEGGTDQISIDGLAGKVADPQEPLAHATSHQAGGADALNVGGLLGELASPQPTKVHSNSYHSPSLATSAELANHIAMNPVHSGATNLANRETTGPDTGLVPWIQLASGSSLPIGPDNGLRSDRIFGHVKATFIGENALVSSLLPGPGYSPLHDLVIPDAWLSDQVHAYISLYGILNLDNAGTLDIRLMYNAGTWLTIRIPGLTDPVRHCIITAHICGVADDLWTATLEYSDDPQITHQHLHRIEHKAVAVALPGSGGTFTLLGQLTSPAGTAYLTTMAAASSNLRAQI